MLRVPGGRGPGARACCGSRGLAPARPESYDADRAGAGPRARRLGAGLGAGRRRRLAERTERQRAGGELRAAGDRADPRGQRRGGGPGGRGGGRPGGAQGRRPRPRAQDRRRRRRDRAPRHGRHPARRRQDAHGRRRGRFPPHRLSWSSRWSRTASRCTSESEATGSSDRSWRAPPAASPPSSSTTSASGWSRSGTRRRARWCGALHLPAARRLPRRAARRRRRARGRAPARQRARGRSPGDRGARLQPGARGSGRRVDRRHARPCRRGATLPTSRARCRRPARERPGAAAVIHRRWPGRRRASTACRRGAGDDQVGGLVLGHQLDRLSERLERRDGHDLRARDSPAVASSAPGASARIRSRSETIPSEVLAGVVARRSRRRRRSGSTARPSCARPRRRRRRRRSGTARAASHRGPGCGRGLGRREVGEGRVVMVGSFSSGRSHARRPAGPGHPRRLRQPSGVARAHAAQRDAEQDARAVRDGRGREPDRELAQARAPR